jgi:hypothetical protein
MEKKSYAQILRELLMDNPLVLLENPDGSTRQYFLSDPDLQYVAEEFLRRVENE